VQGPPTGEVVYVPPGYKYDVATRTWTSPSGAKYTYLKGPKEHAVEHVVAHCEHNPNKPNETLFDLEKDEVLPLLDEAWPARGEALAAGQKNVFVVEMGRPIGTRGETCVKIVTKPGDPSSIVSAYPIESRALALKQELAHVAKRAR